MSNVNLMKDQIRVMSEESADAVAARYRDDAVYVDNARGLTFKGKEEITAMVRELKEAFSNIHAADAEYYETGDWTITRFQGRGTNDGPFGPLPATGKTIDVPMCELFRWQDGKIVEGVIYYDSATMMIQLGHMSPPA